MNKVKNGIWAISAILVLVAAACTKQQAVNAVNTGVQVSLAACQEAPQIIPPGTPEGTIVGLLCPALDGSATKIQVLIDQVIWASMKAAKK